MTVASRPVRVRTGRALPDRYIASFSRVREIEENEARLGSLARVRPCVHAAYSLPIEDNPIPNGCRMLFSLFYDDFFIIS